MRILLVTPPYGDFTYPYHAVAYLVGPLRQAGHTVDVVDLNIAWVRDRLTQSGIAEWRQLLDSNLASMEGLPLWSADLQRRAVDCWTGLALADSIDAESCIEILTGERFYDFSAYCGARRSVRNFERLAGIVHPFFDFFRAFAIPPHEGCAAALVDSVLAAPRFVAELESALAQRLRGSSYDACAISCHFSANLRPGFATLAAMRRLFPHTKLAAGGTAISHLVKNAEAFAALAPLGRLCDAFYHGEADLGINQFFDWLTGNSDLMPAQAVDLGDMANRAGRPHDRVAPIHVDPRKTPLQPPDFSIFDFGSYLSPEPRVNYAPTRGCHWNQCTFCDYGINTDAPAAPYRFTLIEQAAGDIERIRRLGVRHVYFAADSIAPNYLVKLADEIQRRSIDIRWSAQIFLQANLTEDSVERLRRSGMVTASFGLESGSSRVLAIMGKGENRIEDCIEPVVTAFRARRMSLQPMFFFGFPGETDADRQTTIDFLISHRDVFSIITRANYFELTPGSIVAKRPEAFGVTIHGPVAAAPLGGGLEWSYGDGQPAPDAATFEDFNKQLPNLPAFERPWAGGIDTHHTSLYIERFGADVFHRLAETFSTEVATDGGPCNVERESHYDIERAFDNSLILAWSRATCNQTIATLTMGEGGFSEALEAAAHHLTPALRPYRQRLRIA
jgi:anaerobic magnesium-protoporphyrin IX monomethyl ester cyclase